MPVFELSDIERVEKGAIAQVCHLDSDLMTEMGLQSSLVSLSPESLTHIRHRHPDISDWDILMIPRIISEGMVIQERKNPQFVVFSLFVSEAPRKRLNCTVKFLFGKQEAYISTLHKAQKRQLRGLQKRG